MIANKNWNKGRDIKKSDVLIENRELIELHDKAMASGKKEDKEAYNLALCGKLEHLIKSRIRANGFDYYDGEWEDLMVAGQYGVLKNADNYDPRLSLPSSFFILRIDQALKEEVGSYSHLKDHYRNTEIKLKKVAKEYGYEGIFDPDLTPEKLVKLSGISLTTVLNTLEELSIQTVSYGDEWVGDKSAGFESPLSAFIKKEESRVIARVFLKLSDYQKFLLKAHIFENKSFNSISVMLKDEKAREELGLASAPDPSTIRDDFESAKRFMEVYPEFKKMFGYENRQRFRDYTVMEQAPMEYIEEALFPETATGTDL